jgi:hypothetical protein
MNDAFQRLVGKALSDPSFCEALVAHPEATLRASGVEPTAEILDALTGLDAGAVQRLAVALGKSQAAA